MLGEVALAEGMLGRRIRDVVFAVGRLALANTARSLPIVLVLLSTDCPTVAKYVFIAAAERPVAPLGLVVRLLAKRRDVVRSEHLTVDSDILLLSVLVNDGLLGCTRGKGRLCLQVTARCA